MLALNVLRKKGKLTSVKCWWVTVIYQPSLAWSSSKSWTGDPDWQGTFTDPGLNFSEVGSEKLPRCLMAFEICLCWVKALGQVWRWGMWMLLLPKLMQGRPGYSPPQLLSPCLRGKHPHHSYWGKMQSTSSSNLPHNHGASCIINNKDRLLLQTAQD